jgi:hypothetical protein
MKVNWIVATGYQLDPTMDIEAMKQIGPIWGSWTTWRSCATDNVVCYEKPDAIRLVQRSFHTSCNFYAPQEHYVDMGRPIGVNLYSGDYLESCVSIEDIIAMHLVTALSDIVLLMGFDLGDIKTSTDRLESHQIKNRHGLIRSAITNSSKTQWVLVDHPKSLDKAYQNIPNLTCDNYSNVLQLLM